MLDAAAKKKGLTTEKLLDQEGNSKIPDPSDAELEGYAVGLKVTRPLPEVKTQLRDSYKQAKMRQAREDYLKTLRADSNVVVMLSAPSVEVTYQPARMRGQLR